MRRKLKLKLYLLPAGTADIALIQVPNQGLDALRVVQLVSGHTGAVTKIALIVLMTDVQEAGADVVEGVEFHSSIYTGFGTGLFG